MRLAPLRRSNGMANPGAGGVGAIVPTASACASDFIKNPQSGVLTKPGGHHLFQKITFFATWKLFFFRYSNLKKIDLLLLFYPTYLRPPHLPHIDPRPPYTARAAWRA